MCGIAGFIDYERRFNEEECLRIIRRMIASLVHRGPDDQGVWVDAEAGVALASRRLAIRDLSARGQQPMVHAPSGQVLVYNGEIYNLAALRRELEAPERLLGTSDTEVLLESIVERGVVRAVQASAGMFAFGVWDAGKRILSLVRDRIGEKPLFYGNLSGNCFCFASELKALQAHPLWDRAIDLGSLSLYLRYAHVPAPFSIFEGIRKLVPGHVLRLEVSPGEPFRLPRSEAYWSALESVERGTCQPFKGDVEEACAELDGLIRQSVRDQLAADVPVGVFLSGGIDSSLVAALSQRELETPVRTFSMGFYEPAFNEAPFAEKVANHLGTHHHTFHASQAEALKVIPELPQIYDEPFADASQIPTFLIARQARREVTVCLTGDGGDELFGGYNRYLDTPRLWKHVGWIPTLFRSWAASLLGRLSGASRDRLSQSLGASGFGRFLERCSRWSNLIESDSPEDLYHRLISTGAALSLLEPSPDLVAVNPLYSEKESWPSSANLFSRMMYFDLVNYLPDDILVKVDRASMAVGLECRAPLLDHRLVEFACTLPPELKIRGEEQKVTLRRVLARYVPRRLTDRPKRGFAVPLAGWLRGPLRDWAQAVLQKATYNADYFRTSELTRIWEEHQSGRRNWHRQLWIVLMFLTWEERTRERKTDLHHGGQP